MSPHPLPLFLSMEFSFLDISLLMICMFIHKFFLIIIIIDSHNVHNIINLIILEIQQDICGRESHLKSKLQFLNLVKYHSSFLVN